MLGLNSLVLGLLLLVRLTSVSGHFLLLSPNPIGPFDEDTEGSAPCGGPAITFSNTTDFHVDGDAIALESTHPAANWLFRATLDKTGSGNWTDLLPVVAQSALGAFCEPAVKVPESFAGQSGLIQVIQNAVDGELFECAAVNFVSGAASSIPSDCSNATGVTAVFTTDTTLLALATSTGSAASSTQAAATTTTTGTTSTTASAASASASKSAATSNTGTGILGALFWGVVVVFASSL